MGLVGSVSLSYSESAVGTALRVVAAALETAICRGTRGSISEGAEGPDEPEKSEPPSKGFLLEERVLSSSENISAVSQLEVGLRAYRLCELRQLLVSWVQISAAASTPQLRVVASVGLRS